ncbi:MAG: hypothetical protein IT324_23720 [Anaerolineae bacterium]|nr:hypothetical protein [Anaerolineae bacterium]
MGVTVAWGDPDKTAVSMTFAAPWNWAEYDQAVVQVHALLEQVNWPVDVILNLAHGPALPIGRPFAHLGKAITLLRHHIRCLVVIGGSNSSRNILSMFFGIFFPVGHKLFLVNSPEAAQAILTQGIHYSPFLSGNSPGMGKDNRAANPPVLYRTR